MGSGATGNEEDFGFQIAPMVDVVFVLLLFFMACAGAKITEGVIKVNLPGPERQAGPSVPIFIDIDADGKVLVNGQLKSGHPKAREMPALKQYLAELVNSDSQDPLIIRPTADTKHERVMDVLSACKEAKVTNLSFQ